MEICFHPGLHKSGTTTIQTALAEAFGQPGQVWYPVLEGSLRTNHVPLIWSILDKWEGVAHYDYLDRMVKTSPDTFSDVVKKAERLGVKSLIISAEDLDELTESAARRLREVCGNHLVRVVFTASPPLHRWASQWQEAVKHGAWTSPVGTAWVRRNLEVGRLERLVSQFPADVKAVRLVSRDALDSDLVASVVRAWGVEWDSRVSPAPVNESIGADIAVLAHLNATGKTTGLLTSASIRASDEARHECKGRRLDSFSPDDFAVPKELARAAAAEKAYLERVLADGSVAVIDPSHALSTWETAGLPHWYRELMDGSEGSGDPWGPSPLIEDHTRLQARLVSAQLSLEQLEHLRQHDAHQVKKLALELEAHRTAMVELTDKLGMAFQEVEAAKAREHRVRRQLHTIQQSRTWKTASTVARLLGRT